MAFNIEPTPVVYKQEVLYNEEVSLVTSTDIHIFTETTSTPTNSVEVVFVEPTDPNCYCVTYLREVLGINIRGDAKNIIANIDEPMVGAVVLFDYGHAAKIKYRLLDRLIIQESNFEKCTPTERMVMLDDPTIRGYYFANPNAIDKK